MTHTSGKRSFLRKSWAAYIIMPVVFACITVGMLYGLGSVLLNPYQEMVSWFFTKSEENETNRDLYAQAIADACNTQLKRWTQFGARGLNPSVWGGRSSASPLFCCTPTALSDKQM